MTDLISRKALLKAYGEWLHSDDEVPINDLITNAPAITPQQTQTVADVLEELERALCLIGVVGNVDGHDVIRRDSVINVARQRIKRNAEVFNLEQILHDPENQPSQYGTVPLEWYENLENKINRIRFNVEQVIESITGGSDMYAIRKQLQTAVDNKSLATYDKLSEVKHDTSDLLKS